MVAIVAAAASPVVLLSASDIWERSAGNEVAVGVIATSPASEMGLGLTVDVVFSGEPVVQRADAAVSERLTRIRGLSGSATTLFTYVGRVAGSGTTPAESARIIARQGATESLSFVERDSRVANGVFVSSWLADRMDLGLGSNIEFVPARGDSAAAAGSASLVISGIYRQLWSAEDLRLPGYWEDVDQALLPRYQGPFRAPSFALLIMEKSTLADSGLPGAVNWSTTATEPPATLDQLVQRAGEYRNLEAAFVSDARLSGAVGDLAGPESRQVIVKTGIHETLATVESAVSQLDQPLLLVRIVGLLVGLFVMAAVGLFLVDRRRSEYRLLSGEGERWWKISWRAATQLLVPLMVGTFLGVILGVVSARVFGPAESLEWGFLRVSSFTTYPAAALIVASMTVGVVGERSLNDENHGAARRAYLGLSLFAVVATAFLWAQVSRTGRPVSGGLDLAVVALPVVGLVATVLVTVVALRWVVTMILRFWGDPPVGVLFAFRRLASGSRTVQVVGSALGFGIGMVLFSLFLVQSLERTIDVKLATEIGGVTRLDLFGPVGGKIDLPEGSTLVMVQDTRLVPGQSRVRVIAIDSESFADAVDWPTDFGASAGAAVRMLHADTVGAVPVVVIGGDGVPTVGAFGTTNPIPFQVIGTVRSMPLASDAGPTVMVDAERLDDFALARLAANLGTSIDDPQVLDLYAKPTNKFRRNVISKSPRVSLVSVVDAAGMGIRESTTREARAADPRFVASRAAFEYLGLLGIVAFVVALVALTLHLSARKRSSALTSAILRRMGLSRGRSSLMTVIEVGVLTVAVSATSLLAAFVLTRHVAGQFDPVPKLPPDVQVRVPLTELMAVVVTANLIVLAIGFFVERGGWRRNDSEAVRYAA